MNYPLCFRDPTGLSENHNYIDETSKELKGLNRRSLSQNNDPNDYAASTADVFSDIFEDSPLEDFYAGVGDVAETLSDLVVSLLGPNPDGSRGGPAHREKVDLRIKQLLDEGYVPNSDDIIGGSYGRELVLSTPDGRKKTRRPYIAMYDPNGVLYFETAGRSTSKDNGDGSPVPIARKRYALGDIQGAYPSAIVMFSAYDR